MKNTNRSLKKGKEKDTQLVCGPFRGGKAFRPINGFTPFFMFQSFICLLVVEAYLDFNLDFMPTAKITTVVKKTLT